MLKRFARRSLGPCCRCTRRCVARVGCHGTRRSKDDRRCSPVASSVDSCWTHLRRSKTIQDSLCSARTPSDYTSPLCAIPLAQAFCHEPSHISTLASTTAISEHFRTRLPAPLLGVPGTFCVCSRRRDEMIKSAPAVCSSAPSAFVHPSCTAQARLHVGKDGIPLRPSGPS